MKTISSAASTDIVKLAGGSRWVETLDIRLGVSSLSASSYGIAKFCSSVTASSATEVRLLLCNGDVPCCQAAPSGETWTTPSSAPSGASGKCFIPVAYTRDDVSDNGGTASIVTTSVKIGDASGCAAEMLDGLDGLVGQRCTLGIHLVQSELSAYTQIYSPDVSYDFTITKVVHDGAVFKADLSSSVPFGRQWPPRRMYKAACRWKYKGAECQYSGSLSSCAHTIADCIAHGNIERIGCFPGCGTGGLAQ